MKFINLAIIALSSISLVLSKPLTDKNYCYKEFCYLVENGSGGPATIKGFSAKYQNSKVANIPASVNIEGNTFYIKTIDRLAFSKLSTLEEVNIASGISNLTIKYGAFSECPNLKRVVLNCQKYTIDDPLATFTSPNRAVQFLGKGVKDYTDKHMSKIIKNYSLPSKSKYTDLYDYERKSDLFVLARHLSQYRYADFNDGDNAITLYKTGFGTDAGHARLFRLLAIAMGVKSNEILVAYDGKGKYWNYVKVDGYWYNASVNYPFRMVSDYYYAEWKKPFFHGNEEWKGETTVPPSQWLVMKTNYGYKDELRGQPTYENFDSYLRQNNLGSRKN